MLVIRGIRPWWLSVGTFQVCVLQVGLDMVFHFVHVVYRNEFRGRKPGSPSLHVYKVLVK